MARKEEEILMKRRVYRDSGPRTISEIKDRSFDEWVEHLDEKMQSVRSLKNGEPFIVFLIAPAGSGKSFAFQRAAQRYDSTSCVSVRGFLSGDLGSQEPKRLFLDGLDEVRMGTNDWHTPLDKMIGRLRPLKKSLVFISCRDRYWLSKSDTERIKEAFGAEPQILKFAPFSDREIESLLEEELRKESTSYGVLSPVMDQSALQDFIAWMRGKRLFHSLDFSGLKSLFRAWRREKEPLKEGGSAMRLLALECLRETNEQYREYQLATDPSGEESEESLLSMAGRICFFLEFSGKYTIGKASQTSQSHVFDLGKLRKRDKEIFEKISYSSLFTKEGDLYTVRLGSIASFLAAHYMHVMIKEQALSWRRAFMLFFPYEKGVPRLWRECFFFFVSSSSSEQLRSLDDVHDPLLTLLTYDQSWQEMQGWEIISSVNLAYEKCSDLTLSALARLDNSHIARLLEALGDHDKAEDKEEYVHADKWLLSFLKSLRHGPLSKRWERALRRILYQVMWSSSARLYAARALAQLHEQHDDRDRMDVLKEVARKIARGDLVDGEGRLLGALLMLCHSSLSLEEVFDLLQGVKLSMVEYSSLGAAAQQHTKFWHQIFPARQIQSQGRRAFVALLDDIAQVLAHRPAGVEREKLQAIIKKVSPIVLKELFWSWWKISLSSCSSQEKLLFNADRINDYLCSLHISQGGASSQRGEFLCQWLSQHPQTLKDFLTKWLQQDQKILECYPALEAISKNPQSIMFFAEYLLGAPQWPDDFGSWCLEQILSFAKKKSSRRNSGYSPRELGKIHWLSSKIAYCLHKRLHVGGGFSQKVVEKNLSKHNFLLNQVNEQSRLLGQKEQEKRMLSYPQQYSSTEEEEYQRIQESWKSTILHERELFQKNAASSGILSALGRLYLGMYRQVPGCNPHERLRYFFGNDFEVISLAKQGLVGCLTREDHPYDAAYIFNLLKNKKISYSCYAILAGFEELICDEFADHEALRKKINHLKKGSISRVFISRLVAPLADQNFLKVKGRDWLKDFALCYPDEYQEALMRYAKVRLKDHCSISEDLKLMRFDQGVAKNSGDFWLRLAQAFPSSSVDHQISCIGVIVMHGLESCFVGQISSEKWIDLVGKKISHKSMRIKQKVIWIVAYYLLGEFPDDEFNKFFKRSQKRREVLVCFFIESYRDSCRLYGKEGGPLKKIMDCVSCQKMGEIFKLIAPYYRPYHQPNQESAKLILETHEMRAARFLTYVLEAIAEKEPCREDGNLEFFQKFMSNRGLHHWRGEILRAQERLYDLYHRARAHYTYPKEDSLVDFFAEEKPLHAHDLFCVVSEILREEREAIQGTDKNLDFWNMKGATKKPTDIRNEELCRNTLKNYLKGSAQKRGIKLISEFRVKGDICVDLAFVLEGTEFYVPLELKKSNSKDLESAVQEQLVKKYTVDQQSTGGYGFYVVLWSGNAVSDAAEAKDLAGKSTSFPGVIKEQEGPQELEAKLKRALSSGQRKSIEVLVIDVSVASRRSTTELGQPARSA